MSDTNTVVYNGASVGAATWLAVLPFLMFGAIFFLLLYLLPKLQKWVLNVEPVFLNATIVTLLGGFVFSQAWFGMEDSYKYVNPNALFWLKYGFGAAAGMLMALKAFLSQDYAKHLDKVKDEASGKVTETITDIHTEEKIPPITPLQPVPEVPPSETK